MNERNNGLDSTTGPHHPATAIVPRASVARTYAFVIASDDTASPNDARVVDLVLSNCTRSRIPHVGILAPPGSRTWETHADAGTRAGGPPIRVLRSSSAHPYRGTADAVHQNRDVIRSLAPSHVFVLTTEHPYSVDYGTILADHLRSGADVTIGCAEVPIPDADRYDLAAVDADDRVTDFTERFPLPDSIAGRSGTALASLGIYLFDTDFLLDALIQDEEDPVSTHDFVRDVIPHAVDSANVTVHRVRTTRHPTRDRGHLAIDTAEEGVHFEVSGDGIVMRLEDTERST